MAYREEEHGQKGQPRAVVDLIFDRKFNVALRESHGARFLEGLNSGTLTPDDALVHKLALHYTDDRPGQSGGFRANINLFPRLYLDLCDDSPAGRFVKSKVWSLVERVTNLQLAWLTHNWEYPVDPCLQRRTSKVLSVASRTSLINRLAAELSTLTPVIDRSGRRTPRISQAEQTEDYIIRLARTNTAKILTLKLRVVWSDHACAILYNGAWYYFAKPYLLLIHNKISDILSVLVYAALTPYETYRWNLYAITAEFIHSWAECAWELNQDFFRVSKLLEAVGIGLTLQETEGESNEQFLQTVMRSTRPAIGLTLRSFRFYRVLSRASIEVRHELMCLSKVMGHPFCDIEAGAADLHSKVTAEKELDPVFIRESVQRAKEDFVKHYYRRHGKWPLCKLHPGLPQRVTAMILRNRNPFDPAVIRQYGAIALEHYDLIELLPIKEFDWVENFLPHIKDRTISALRSSVIQHYIRKSASCVRWQDTRLLLLYMLNPREMTDHVHYLKDYMAGRWEMLQDYLIIRIVPKEKEHKREARGFGCKTALDRARTIIQEHNTAGILAKYSSEHVMTLDELALAKKLLAFRHMCRAYHGYRMIIVSVDASAWNNAFRAEALHPMMEETLDALHGVSVWSKTQTAYEQSFIYMPDIDKVYSWDGQAGGIEGLNQYTWVYAYIHQMKVCMREQPYPYYILCKGDDLRLAVLVAPELLEESSIDVIKQVLLESVSRIGKKFGHTIKIEDSYASESYFAFSKDAYVQGVEQSQAMRKIQKCYGANNAFLNILDDYVSSAMSNAHSASRVAPSPVTTYMVGAWWAYYAITEAPQYKSLSDHQLAAYLLVPNMLGGFPIIYLHNMFVRAESDLLPPYLDLCRFTRDYDPQLHEYLMRAWCHRIVEPEKCLAGLMVDIYSLPIARPRTAPSVLRREMTTFLSSYTKNEDLQRLFKATARGVGKSMLRTFATANVYNAKLMGALYSCTPEQITEELVRKFETGKSIYLALLRYRGYRRAIATMKRVSYADTLLHRFRCELLSPGVRHPPSVLPDDALDRCSGEVCDQLRAELWGKPVIGVTQPSPQHQVFGGWIERIDPTPYNLRFHFELWHTHPSGELPHLFSIGASTPFIGAETGRGLAKPKAELVTPSVFTDKIRVILEVYQWSKVAGIEGEVGNLHLMCEQLLLDYTGREVREFIPYAGETRYHKTVQHHVRANSYRASIVPNTLLNIYTTMKGNIYAHQYFKTSIEHYRVNYLQVFCHMVSLTALPWWCGDGQKLTPRVWAVSTRCEWCLQPLFETPVIVQDESLPTSDLTGILRLSPHDLDNIRDELDSLEIPEMYAPPEEVDANILELSKQGLCEYLTANMWSQKIAVQLATTQHHMSSRGADNAAAWLGTTIGSPVSIQEVRIIGAESLIRSIAPLVRYYILTAFPYRLDDRCLAAMMTAPAEQLPWHGFLEILGHAFLTYEVQRVIRELAPRTDAVTVDTTRGLTHQFGHFCFHFAPQQPQHIRLIVLSYQQEVRITRSVQLRIDSLRWEALDHTVGAALREARIVGTRELIIKLTESLLALAIMDEEEFKAQIPAVGEHNIQASLFPPITDVTEFLAPDMFHRAECDHPSMNEPIVAEYTEFYNPSDFVQLVVRRYNIGWVTMQVFIHRIYEDGAIYETTHAAALFQAHDPRIELIHLDPVTCLNHIKSAADSEPMVETPLLQGAATPRFSRRVANSLYARLPTGRVAGAHIPLPLEPGTPQLLPEVNPIFVPTSCLRTSGVGNQSMSKIIWLFQVLHIHMIPDESLVLCLGDGFGGLTSVVTAMTRRSTIVFNTLPLNPGTTPLPLDCYPLAQAYANKIDTADMEVGIYDLTSPMLVDVYSERYKSVDLVLCDAETPTLTGGRYDAARTAIIKNVISLFVRCGKPGSLLILKVYGHEWTLWSSPLHALTQMADPVDLVHSMCSYQDGEMYIVAHLVAPTEGWKVPAGEYPSLVATRRITRFFTRLAARCQEDRDREGLLTIERKHSAAHSAIVAQVPCWGWSKVSEVLKVDVPLALRKPAPIPKRWARDTLSFLDTVQQPIEEEVRTGPRGQQAYTYDTMTHAVLLIDRLCVIQALKWTIESTALRGVPLHHAPGVFVVVEYLYTLPRKYGLRRITEQNFTTTTHIQRVECNLYGSWRQAVRWGISILTHNLCLWQHDQYRI